jgi:hypothetical protein
MGSPASPSPRVLTLILPEQRVAFAGFPEKRDNERESGEKTEGGRGIRTIRYVG